MHKPVLREYQVYYQIDALIMGIIDNNYKLNLEVLVNQLNAITIQSSQAFYLGDKPNFNISLFIQSILTIHSNRVIESIVWCSKSAYVFYEYICTFKSKIAQKRLESQSELRKRNSDCIQYAKQCLNRYHKSRIVFMTLTINPEGQDQLSLDDFKDYHQLLLKAIKNHVFPFNDVVGYIWRIEQSLEQGFHIHLWLCYNGDNVQCDTKVGIAIGQYWQTITKGFGDYHNSNCTKNKTYWESIDKLGIGAYHRDKSKIDNYLSVVNYLAHPDKVSELPKVMMRSFGRGQITA